MYVSLAIATLALVALVLAYWQRNALAAAVPDSVREWAAMLARNMLPGAAYERLAGADWQTAVDAGLTSSRFDIEANIRGGDPRAGLDEAGLAAVHRIMSEQRVSFDEARLRHHRAVLASHNIDPRTGMPLDAKAVTRL